MDQAQCKNLQPDQTAFGPGELSHNDHIEGERLGIEQVGNQSAPEARRPVALRRGGQALACSDAFFGPMNNLIAPGRAVNMGGGWETKRRRTPGSDWILVQLGEVGKVGLVEIDTNHFKGNYPDRCALWGIYAPGARITELMLAKSWKCILPESKVTASQRHFFRKELDALGPFTHVRLEIFPDGGVSRLRVYGKPSGASELPLKSDLEA